MTTADEILDTDFAPADAPALNPPPARWRLRFDALWPHGLWARLALSLVAAIAPLLALLFVAVSAEGRRVIQDAQWQATQAARLGADQQQAMLQQAASLLRVLARVPAVRAGAGECGAFLGTIAKDMPQVGAISVTNTAGAIVCSSRPASLGLSVADRPFFSEAMALRNGNGFALSELGASRIDGKPLIFISVPLEPVTAGDPPPGTVTAVLHLGWFASLPGHVAAGAETMVEVLDSRDGALIARLPDERSMVGLRFPEYALVNAFRAAPGGGTLTATDLDGTERMFAFAPLPGRSDGLLIAVGLSANAIQAAAHRRMVAMMGIGLGVAALAILISWMLAQQSLVRPLRALSAAASRLGAGDLSSTADISNSVPLELRALGGTFGRMAKRLRLRDRRIELMRLELAESESQHRLLADSVNDMITRFSSELRRVYVSPACRDLLGYEPAELLGDLPGGIVHPEDWPMLDATLNQRLLAGYPTARATYRAFRKNGTVVWVESSGRSLGGGEGFVVVTRDVTERKAMEAELALANRKLRVLVRQDGLTGLANRRRFDELLDDEFRRLVRSDKPLALIMLDVDCFKLFNDTYGHPAGDRCLQMVARVIEGALRRSADVAARYGGEEFALLLPELGADGAREVASRVQEAVHEAAMPHTGSGIGIVTVSMGIAVIHPSRCPAGPAIAIQQADAALYRAKREGRNTVRLADETAEAVANDVSPLRSAPAGAAEPG